MVTGTVIVIALVGVALSVWGIRDWRRRHQGDLDKMAHRRKAVEKIGQAAARSGSGFIVPQEHDGDDKPTGMVRVTDQPKTPGNNHRAAELERKRRAEATARHPAGRAVPLSQIRPQRHLRQVESVDQESTDSPGG